jgi:hypothetical protein
MNKRLSEEAQREKYATFIVLLSSATMTLDDADRHDSDLDKNRFQS